MYAIAFFSPNDGTNRLLHQRFPNRGTAERCRQALVKYIPDGIFQTVFVGNEKAIA